MRVRQVALAAWGAAAPMGAVAAPVSFTSIIDSPGAVVIESGMFDNVFGGASAPNFTDDTLASMHDELNADGVETDGYITILAADTSDGLAVFALIDREFGVGLGAVSSSLDFLTIADTDDAVGWINDDDSDLWDAGSLTNSFEARFTWSDAVEGDGFAWSNLDVGDSASFTFLSYVGSGIDNGFRFVTWTGDAWAVAADAGMPSGVNQSVDFVVIPSPPSLAALTVAMLAGAGARRRRDG